MSTLLTLPFHIQDWIFSYLPVFAEDDEHNSRYVSATQSVARLSMRPVLAVRCVCRQLRAVINESPLWLEVELFNLIPSKQREEHGNAFVRSLLTGPHLVERLSRRNEWTFQSPQSFLSISDTMMFRENVMKLKLLFRYNKSTDTQTILEHISHCNRLTDLTLTELDHLDFVLIATYQSLRQLEVYFDDFWMHSSGQLCTLSNLNSLRVRIAKYASNEFSEPKALLPLNSTASLTHFSYECDEFDFDADSLALFVNLNVFVGFSLDRKSL